MSAILYSLFTYDCKAHEDSHCLLSKYADATTLAGLVLDNDGESYRFQLNELVTWCKENNLFLNVGMTKELVVDFRRNKNVKLPLIIEGLEVKQVSSFKLLGSIIKKSKIGCELVKNIIEGSATALHFTHPKIVYSVKVCYVQCLSSDHRKSSSKLNNSVVRKRTEKHKHKT